MPDDEPIPPPWLRLSLHASYDAVLQEPIRKELLIASGEGASDVVGYTFRSRGDG